MKKGRRLPTRESLGGRLGSMFAGVGVIEEAKGGLEVQVFKTGNGELCCALGKDYLRQPLMGYGQIFLSVSTVPGNTSVDKPICPPAEAVI